MISHTAGIVEPKLAGVLAALEWDRRMGINMLIARLTGVSRQAVNQRLKRISSDKGRPAAVVHAGGRKRQLREDPETPLPDISGYEADGEAKV